MVGSPAPLVKGGALMPRQKGVCLPNNPKAALAEAARVYREARRGQLDVEVASRLSYQLKTCADIHRDHVLKAELDALRQDVAKIVAALQVKV